MDPEFDPSLCPTCFFHTSLSPYPSTDLHLPLPVLVQLPIFPACLTCPPCTFSDDDKRCGHATRLLWVWLWVAHCSIVSAHGRRNGGGCGCNRNKAGCGISPNDSEHGSLRPSSHQRQLHVPGGDMAVHGAVLGAVCRVG